MLVLRAKAGGIQPLAGSADLCLNSAKRSILAASLQGWCISVDLDIIVDRAAVQIY